MPEQNNAINSLAHTKRNCKYHIVFAPKYRRKEFFAEKREAIREILRILCQWKIKEYIENQLKADRETIPETRLRVASNPMRGWQANKKRTCALPVILGLCPKRKYPPLCGGIFIRRDFK